jgi:hypothetical protein
MIIPGQFKKGMYLKIVIQMLMSRFDGVIHIRGTTGEPQ